jgi:hypothetical protein
MMFGPDWTFVSDMSCISLMTDASVPRAALIDIVSTWHASVNAIASWVELPCATGRGVIACGLRMRTGSPDLTPLYCIRIRGRRLYWSAGQYIDFYRMDRAFPLEHSRLRCDALSGPQFEVCKFSSARVRRESAARFTR